MLQILLQAELTGQPRRPSHRERLAPPRWLFSPYVSNHYSNTSTIPPGIFFIDPAARAKHLDRI